MWGHSAKAITAAAALGLVIGASTASAHSQGAAVPHYSVARYPLVTPRYAQFGVVDPGARGVLYVGKAWSRDGGTTWAPAPISADDGHAYGFATGRRVAYRVDGDGAVDRSRDGGKTWARRGVIPSDLANIYNFVTVEPYETNVVCLQHYAGSPSGLPDVAILSSDGGATWRSAPTCRSFTSSAAGTLVADATTDTGVTVSRDGGRSWVPLANDLPAGAWHLTADPSTPRSVYATSTDATSADGLFAFRSTDGGTAWTALAKPPLGATASPRTVLVDPTRPGALVVSERGHLWLSRDHGASWKLTPRRLPADPAGFDAAGTLYILSSSPMRSADDGSTWVWSSHGLGGTAPTALAVDPTSGASYLMTSGGLLRLGPDYKTWRPISPFGMAAAPYGTSPTHLVVTHGTVLFDMGDGRAVRSTNNGTSFAELDAEDFTTQPFAAVGTTSTIVGSVYAGGVTVSNDAGLTWTQSNGATPNAGIAALAQAHGSVPTTLFEETYGDIGEYIWSRSIDLGVSWQPWLTIPSPMGMVAATANAEYFGGTLAPDSGGSGLAIAGPATTLRQIRLFDRIFVWSVATSLAHPALAVVLGSGPEGALRTYLTNDSGTTWKRLSLPVGRYCTPVGAALTPDDRLVAAFQPVSSTSTHSGVTCRTASIVSTPLTR